MKTLVQEFKTSISRDTISYCFLNANFTPPTARTAFIISSPINTMLHIKNAVTRENRAMVNLSPVLKPLNTLERVRIFLTTLFPCSSFNVKVSVLCNSIFSCTFLNSFQLRNTRSMKQITKRIGSLILLVILYAVLSPNQVLLILKDLQISPVR